MCGVFAISGLDITDAGEKVIEGLKKLEYRGYDSWGVATSHEMQKEVGKISCSTATFSQDSKAIGHSRWATHGGVTQENSHPHQYKKVTLVHNGIFENYLSEKNRLLEKGETFLSETDSEVIAHLIQEQLDLSHDPKSAIQNVAKAITGRFSIVVMIENFDEIFVARRGSPLIIGRGKGEYAQTTFIASDIPAFLEYTNVVNYIDDDEMAIIKNDDVAFYNLCSGEHIEKRNIAVSWKEEIAEKGDYNHFMIKEIFDQKQSLTSAINHSDKEIQEFISALQSGNGVYMVACGTTHKASIAAEYYFSQIAGRKINVVPASEMPAFERFINEKTVLFAVSQSGETADILEILELGKKRGAKIISITNVESSSIARMSDNHLPIRAGKEKAVVSTKATTSQMALLLLLAYADDNRLNEGRLVLQDLASNVNDLLNPRYEEYIKSVAETLNDCSNIFIIGRNSLFPMALESAIKILEVSYIHAQGFAAGEMKHGPIALIEQGTPCIVLGCDSETISNAMELKSRGATIIGVAHENNALFDQWLKIPSAGTAISIASILPIQILSYYLATLRGLDPDMPRNLAKSVTVK